MKKLLILPLIVFAISGCNSSDSKKSSLNEGFDKQSKSKIDENIKKIHLLGTNFEWQNEPVEKKSWQEAIDYCQGNGMRLPTSREFFAILDTNRSIDEVFPSNIKEFWTSDSYDNDRAWKISTWTTTQTYRNKSSKLGVRCLKNGKLDTHTYEKKDNKIIDTNENTAQEKIWQDLAENGTNKLTFEQAQNYCKSYDMRLPTLFELEEFLDASPNYVKKGDFLSYWSSTPLPTDKNSVMSVDFTNGAVLFSDKKENNHIRCVKIVDKKAPVIYLNGDKNITIDQNQNYTELGAYAIDETDGNVSVQISGSVDITKAGVYTITYTAKDSANNISTLTRSVRVKDITKPDLTLIGSNPQIVRIHQKYEEYGAKAVDDKDGNISEKIIIDSSEVNISKVGDYNVTYTVSDSSNNSSILHRIVRVVDTLKPIITLNGSNPQRVEVNTDYIEQFATAHDNADGDITSNIKIDSSNLNINQLGQYLIKYSVKDSSGNIAIAQRVVQVVDTTKPVINLIGDDNITVAVNEEYSDLGAVVSDNYDSSVQLRTSGSVDSTKVGVYYMYYDANDSSSNVADQKHRVVNVVDTIAPELSLIGESFVVVERNQKYIDQGAVATDNYDKNITNIKIVNPVDENKTGIYYVTYNVKDSSGNSAAEITRKVIVRDLNNSNTNFDFSEFNMDDNDGVFKSSQVLDIDQDGDIDLLISLNAKDSNTGRVLWYENQGDNSFVGHNISDNLVNVSKVSAFIEGDYTNLFYLEDTEIFECDNIAQNSPNCSVVPLNDSSFYTFDIVELNSSKRGIVGITQSSSLSLFKKNLDGSYQKFNVDQIALDSNLSIKSFDFDKDGYMDIVLGSIENNQGYIKYYINDQNGNFIFDHKHHSFGANLYDIADIDGDSKEDIIFASTLNSKVLWHSSVPSDPDIESSVFELTDANIPNISDVIGADMDGDGDNDIVVSSSGLDGGIVWFENILNELGNQDKRYFPKHEVVSTTTDVVKIIAADIDSDNNMDIIAIDKNGSIKVYISNKAESITIIPQTEFVSDRFIVNETNQTVKDRYTNLLWQNQNDTASEQKTTFEEAKDICKDLRLGGYDDWRLPDRNELFFLAPKGDSSENTDMFDIFHTQSSDEYYWTSSKNMISINLKNGLLSNTNDKNLVKCVRGKKEHYHLSKHKHDGVVKDKVHALMWEINTDTAHSLDSAVSECKTHTTGGYSDWRLPNINELFTIFNDKDGLDKAFKDKSDYKLFSSTTQEDTDGVFSGTKMYIMDQKSGLNSLIDTDSSIRYRCVREISNEDTKEPKEL